MKAQIVMLNKNLAKDYLKRNINNRKVNKATLDFYKHQMNNGNWKENGEPIIIDKNGEIKDGQHRLIAVAETGYIFQVPVITEVDPDVMDTIDTGKNRSASDVLHLHGFKYSNLLASSVKSILLDKITHNGKSITKLSNHDVLKYTQNNISYLYELIKEAKEISSLQISRVLTDTMIIFYIHKYGNTGQTITFLKNILGIERKPKTATDYVYKKLFLSKTGEERISLTDKQKYIQRAYEYFIQGNPEVKGLKIRYNKKNGKTLNTNK